MSSSIAIDEDRQRILSALESISDCADKIIAQAKHDLTILGAHEFVSNKLGQCFQLVTEYKNAFNMLFVKTRKEFEAKVSDKFCYSDVRDGFENLLDSELELEGLGAKVLMLSFGERSGALKWIEETDCPFDVLLDQDRRIYNAFGLYRWVSKVWNIEIMVYYAEQLLAGRALPKPYENVKDDPIQMGGDFILDQNGVIIFSYPSQSSSDRPSVDCILSAIQEQTSNTLE